MNFKYLDFTHHGYSGSEVLIDPERKKVIKIDSKKTGILLYQYKTLELLSRNLNSDFIKVPKVINFSSKKNHDILEIEFIKGLTLYHIFKSGQISFARKIIKALWQEWSEKLKNQIPLEGNFYLPVGKNAFDLKIKNLKNAASRLGIYNNIYTSHCFNKVKFIENIPITFCHGDFTIENIIFSNDAVYIYDFIPSPFSCIEQDLSKLIQDGVGGWANRFDTKDSFNFEQFLVIDDIVTESLKKNIIDICILESLSFFSMLRIMPYIKHESEISKWIYSVARLKRYFS